jgi:hypothetical protein
MNLIVTTCRTCGTRMNGILCLRCLDGDIQRDRAAREAGAKARKIGQPLEANPHTEKGNAEAWALGWTDGPRPAETL